MKISTAFGTTAALVAAAAVAYLIYEKKSKEDFIEDITSSNETIDSSGTKQAEVSTLDSNKLLIRQKNLFTGNITTYRVDPDELNWFEQMRLKTLSKYTLF